MSACPACGHQNQPGAKFCSECATALVQATPHPSEERKVVTVVFVDLVGFTSRAERLDPEDVRALLSPYYARLRTDLERFGGSVEKFIGDAVMALFGAPVAHEDDPERAVRAALAIRDWAQEQEALALQLRIAVTTGEALVALTARTAEGEGMASGDVVNTAARLQAAAPVNGILVGETTWRATSHVIVYREADPVTAKGKAEPVRVWEAVEARARFGSDLPRLGSARLIGRADELSLLEDSLARVCRDRSAQLVTIVGVPGIGKSRLVAELFRAVDADPGRIVLWRQGRSLPYGDGITFWALAEMVKAHTGILETDAPELVTEKLRAAVGEVVDDPAEAQWVEGHVAPLVGSGAGGEVGGDRRSEAFAAWRRFFEALAERTPLVLVFEDIQWADDNLLEFIEHLADWVSGVPLLIVCTARPELLERRASWGGGKRNAATLSLPPLSDEETARLIAALTDRPVLLASTQEALLTRAGGNPLYAEQYVRMLAERGQSAEMPLPETVQGIIAARLDALTGEEKRLLQDAAVVGKVFWVGALGAVGGVARRDAETMLHALERKEFVQRARRSSVGGEAEHSFRHLLVRDVAYGQITRGRRAEKHRLAAGWIESLGRSEDHAEMLAHHYLSALELGRAAGQPVDGPFAERVLRSLGEAAARAFSLHAYASAAGLLEAALALAPPGSGDRGPLLFQLGRARLCRGDLDPEVLTAACTELLDAGDRENAAEAEATLGDLWWTRGDRDRAFEHLGRARDLVDGLAPSRVRASITTGLSRFLMLAADNTEAIRVGRQALAMAEALGLDELRAAALNNVGAARLGDGDLGGIADLEESVAIAREANAPDELCRALGNLAAMLWSELGALLRSAALWEEAAETATRFGQGRYARWCRAADVEANFTLGRWDRALTACEAFIAEVEAGSPHYLAPTCYATRAQIRLARGDVSGAVTDAERALALARLAKDPQNLYPTIATAASVFLESGRREMAASLAAEFLAQLRARQSVGAALSFLHLLASTLARLDGPEELVDVLSGIPGSWAEAAVALAGGDLRRAADICGAMGAGTEEASDRLQLAAELIGQNRRPEAEVELDKALAFYRSVGATRYVRQGEALRASSADHAPPGRVLGMQ